jgi:hypothetical protein
MPRRTRNMKSGRKRRKVLVSVRYVLRLIFLRLHATREMEEEETLPIETSKAWPYKGLH